MIRYKQHHLRYSRDKQASYVYSKNLENAIHISQILFSKIDCTNRVLINCTENIYEREGMSLCICIRPL